MWNSGVVILGMKADYRKMEKAETLGQPLEKPMATPNGPPLFHYGTRIIYGVGG